MLYFAQLLALVPNKGMYYGVKYSKISLKTDKYHHKCMYITCIMMYINDVFMMIFTYFIHYLL